MAYWYRKQTEEFRFFLKSFPAFKRDISPYATWFGDDEGAALIHASSGRLLGFFEHDGHGKYDIVVYASLWRALHLLSTGAPIFRWHMGISRCVLMVVRSKEPADAAEIIQVMTGANFISSFAEE